MGNKQFYQSVIDSFPLAYAYHHIIRDSLGIPVDYEFLEVNPAFEQMTGLKASDVIGRKVTDILPDINKEEFDWITFYGNIASGVTSDYIEKYLNTNSTWYRVYAYSPLPETFVTFFRNISHEVDNRREIEKSLVDRNNKLNSIIKAAPVGIGVVEERVFIEVNDTLCKMTGYTAEELIGQSSAMLYPTREEYDYVGYEKYRQINEHHVGTVETKWRKKDGSLVDILLSSAMIEHDNPSSGVTFTALDITEKKKADAALEDSEQKYRLIAENTADTITILDLNLQNIYASPSMVNLRGYQAEEALTQSIDEILTPDSLQKVYGVLQEELESELKGHSNPYRSRLLELKYYHKNGTTIWVENKVSFIRDENLKPKAILNVSRDISMRKRVEEEIFKQRAEFEALFTNTNDAMAFFDKDEITTNINSQFTNMFGYELEEAKGKNVNSLVDPLKKISTYGSTKTLKGQNIELETVRYSKTGQPIQVSVKGGPVYIDGEISGAYAVYTDITERKRYEEELKYLSLHDTLTGLYNRSFFEEELNRLGSSREYPITIISVDVDGLKLINDTLGHDNGDEILKACAEILKNVLRSSDILARIGGDEFTVLLPNTDEHLGELLIRRIRQDVDKYNKEHLKKPLSISVGLATATDSTQSLKEAFKKADDSMYRNKLHKASSAKSKIIDALMKALGERDYITEGHAKRLNVLCEKLGERKGLSSSQIDNLTLLAQVHDLGKVGIPDNILFKEGPLTEEEWKTMRQHSEKGFRIALASPELSGIADLILKHHERWDGAGYPLGLSKNEIPVECRILAIVDAYDAMTNDRPYCKARTSEEALNELNRCSGTQFDPELVEIFLSITKRLNQ